MSSNKNNDMSLPGLTIRWSRYQRARKVQPLALASALGLGPSLGHSCGCLSKALDHVGAVLRRRTKGHTVSWAPQRPLVVAARFSLPAAGPQLGVLQKSLHLPEAPSYSRQSSGLLKPPDHISWGYTTCLSDLRGWGTSWPQHPIPATHNRVSPGFRGPSPAALEVPAVPGPFSRSLTSVRAGQGPRRSPDFCCVIGGLLGHMNS